MVTENQPAAFAPPTAFRGLAAFALWAATLALALLVFLPPLLEHARTTGEPTVLPRGAAQHLAPYMIDPADRDLIATYFRDVHPLGYRWLLNYFVSDLDHGTYGHLAPYFLLALILMILAWGVHTTAGWSGVLIVIVLGIASDGLLDKLAGGTPRAYAPLVVALTAAGLLRGRPLLLILGILISALFYPPMIVASGLALAGFMALPPSHRGCAAPWSPARRYLFLGLLAATSLALLFPVVQRSAVHGPTLTRPMLHQYPEAMNGGRLDRPDRIDTRARVLSAYRHALPELLIGQGRPLAPALRALLETRDFGLREPWRLRVFLGAVHLLIFAGFLGLCITTPAARRLGIYLLAIALATWLANLLSPRLFLPSRHAGYAFPVLMLILIPMGLRGLARFFLGQASGTWIRRHQPWMTSVFTVLFAAFLLLSLGNRVHPEAGHERISRNHVRLLLALHNLPPESLIAGWPTLLDPVTPLTGHRVLINHHVNLPYHLKYTEEMRRRMIATIEAMYATGPGPFLALAETWGVTHLVLAKDHFLRPPTYHAPYLFLAALAAQRIQHTHPYLFNLPRAAIVFENTDFLIIDLDRLRWSMATSSLPPS
ncbi:MAG TPA: hypothetical protein PKE55_09205 [Kiritimatiellia bacterium]|nr:hypothetical protein [Kiritimatiellia bacterium]